jgi:hypothetical protein
MQSRASPFLISDPTLTGDVELYTATAMIPPQRETLSASSVLFVSGL